MIDFKRKIEEEDRIKHEEAVKHNGDNLSTAPKNKWITTYTVAIIVLALIFTGRILMSSFGNTDWIGSRIINNFKHLIPINGRVLAGEKNDRINILLMGIGGKGHDGAYLTDTIMLVSFKPSTRQIALISIPRDLVTPVSNWEKINSIDAYAESENPGSGGRVTDQAISTLLQIPIQYYVRLDFQGFTNIINELGGVTVNVKNTLDDYKYPIAGQGDNPNYFARYEHLHINAGPQFMNGSLALKYARSRHALGVEGSDFARARRQQLVIEAIKNKLFSAQTLLNPVIITRIIKEFNKNISTNLNVWEILRIWNMFKSVKHSQIITKVISNAPNSFLVAGQGQDGAYILTPRSGNFNNIRNFVKNIFLSNTKPFIRANIPSIDDNASVIVLNGTWIGGLAGKNAVLLEQAKFKVLKITNAPTRDYKQTVVYDLSHGSHGKSLKVLQKITGAFESFKRPNWLISYETSSSSSPTSSSTIYSNTSPNLNPIKFNIENSTTSPNFIVILGTDANRIK